MAETSPIVAVKESSAILATIKSLVVFNAFAVLAIIGLVVFGHPSVELWYALVFVTAVTVALNVFALLNPRFLTYGPAEYLRESEMAHEREMTRLHAQATAAAPSASKPTSSATSHT